MSRKIVAVWVSILIMLSFIVVFVKIAPVIRSSAIIYVDDVPGEGPGNPAENYTSIQDAINAANDGDTIYVYNGSYYEAVGITKMITLIGEDRNSTLIDRKGNGDDVYIFTDWVNITGFTIHNSGAAGSDRGITISDAKNVTIFNNNISYNDVGIYLTPLSSNINIIGNVILSNGEDGIHLFSSDNNIIDNDIILNGRIGLDIDSNGPYSERNNILNNNISENVYGIGLKNCNWSNITNNKVMSNTNDGLVLFSSFNNIIIYNNFSSNDNCGIYLYQSGDNNCSSNFISNTSVGITLETSLSNNNIIFNNIIWNNSGGISLKGMAFNNTIINNRIFSNNGGISFFPGCYNNVINNNITNNKFVGIHFESDSEYNLIVNNDISMNKDGVTLLNGFPRKNIFKGNNIILNNENGIEIISSSANEILNNNISGNKNGLYLIGTWNNQMTENKILSNTEYGIYLNSTSNQNTIARNYISDNGIGINLSSSSDNIIIHNNIITNINQAFDDSIDSNLWDNGYPSGGNFWSDYSGIDFYNGPNQDQLGSDGIGDTNYSIDSNSIDNYPLMEPFENYTILQEGWNLVSIPLIQSDQNLMKVLEFMNGSYDAVQWYSNIDPIDSWKHYNIGKPFGNDLFELNETMGFWIHITRPGDTIFLYNGTQPTSNQIIQLYPGWNMVGYPSLTSYNRTEGLNNLTFNDQVDAIWSYDASTQKWEEMGASDYFELSRGYWIHATQECVWEVPL